MERKLRLTALLSTAVAMLMLYGCSKDQKAPAPGSQQASSLPTTADGKHVYGLLPTPQSEWSQMPAYNEASFKLEHNIDATKAAPAVLNLVTPAVRDQGQIGSCTGFAGSEAYEITYNYTHGAFPPLVNPIRPPPAPRRRGPRPPPRIKRPQIQTDHIQPAGA